MHTNFPSITEMYFSHFKDPHYIFGWCQEPLWCWQCLQFVIRLELLLHLYPQGKNNSARKHVQQNGFLH